jgi:hypothetical protein
MQENGTTAPTDNQTSNSTPEPPIDANLEPPVDAEIYFDSMSEIKNFFSEKNTNQPNNSTELVGKSIFQYATQSQAEIFIESANAVQYPVANFECGLKYRRTGLTGPYLQILYEIDGIQYGFFYYYECSSVINREGVPAFSGVEIGPYTVDLYRYESNYPCFTGSILINGFNVSFRVQGKDCEEKFDFSAFNFVSLNDIAENVTA